MKALIIVDYENDLVDGALGFPGAPLIENKIIDLIPSYDKIIYTFIKNKSNYLDTFNGKVIPVLNCIEGTDGMNPYGKLKDYINEDSLVFYKETYASIELAEYLKNHKEYNEIDLVGVVSHKNVLATAILIKTYSPETLVTVLKDAVATFDKTLEARGFNILNALGVEIK